MVLLNAGVNSQDILQIVVLIVILVFSVVIHEVAHGWTADKCGDPTARSAGRVTLNPLPHIDLFGSIIIPGVLIIMNTLVGGLFVFGYAKPVPVDPRNFRNYKRDDILVSLAGPGSNFLLAIGFAILAFVIFSLFPPEIGSFSSTFFSLVCFYGIVINVVLGTFNLIPIPPLDGSHVVSHMLPHNLRMKYLELSKYGIFLVLAIVLLPSYIFNVSVIGTIVRFVISPFLLLTGSNFQEHLLMLLNN